MRFTGTLKTWNDERGFGFIESAQVGEDLFVHIKDFPSGSGRPVIGQVLSFTVAPGANGKQRACALEYPARRKQSRGSQEAPAPWTLPRLLAIPVFIAVYIALVWRWGLSLSILLAYTALSLLTLLMYAFDKSAALAGRWRIPENTLHLLALAGGWPGALLAQQLLRHKTRKQGFISVFWLTVLINVAALVAWHAGLLPLALPF